MGFFFPEGIAVPQRVERRERMVKFRSNEPSARGCDACTLQKTWVQLTTPQMPIDGAERSDILVVGEGPGEEEDFRGRPFVGRAGALLRRVMPMRQSERIAMTNAVRCRPMTASRDNRVPTAREVEACSIHLENDIAAGNYTAILGLGGAPLARFFTEATITQSHGLKFPVAIGGKVLWYYPTLHPSFVNRTGGDKSPMLPVFENDIKTFFRDVDHWPKPVIENVTAKSVTCAYDEDEAAALCRRMLAAGKPIGFDIETNDLRPNVKGAAIMTAAVSDGAATVAWPVSHPELPNDWGLPLALNMTQRLRWVAHHAGFELAWLTEHARRQSIPWEPAAGFDDSMVAARLYQRRASCLNLGVLTRLYCGVNVKRLSDINPNKIAETPLSEVLPYNGLDAWGSWQILDRLGDRVDPDNYRSIIETIQSVTEMQLLGLDVDRAAATELLGEWQGRAQAAALRAMTVYEVKRYTKDREFNIGSNEQVGEALVTYGRVTLPKTPGGQYSTDDKTLTDAAPDNPLVKDVLEYRHAKKMESTYVLPVLAAAERFVDGRLHPVYSTSLTHTLRLSSEDVNIQNFPKRKDHELRRPVVPPKGCLWASADWGQLEARVYGMASKDPALCDSIIADEDIHSYWLNVILEAYPPYFDRLASKVTPNDTEAQIRKGGRDIIKSDFVFATFFGTTARNVSERTGIPPDIATEVLGLFWRRYAAAHRWLKGQRSGYRDNAAVRNLCGVERYGIMLGNEPINHPIQSTAARLVLEAQNEVFGLAKRHGDLHFMPRINIHDDLVFALPDDSDLMITYIKEISKVLTKVRFDWQIVPLKVEWKVGANWADLEAVHEFTGDYRRKAR
jgi:uracil-DNA glycosylase family 4